MSLRPIYGHEAMLHRLAGALASSRFPQAALFVGPPGVGKQRLALWVAQGLLCESGPGAPCGECRSCHQVLDLQHPDLHWFVPITRPKAGDPDKQVAEAEELLGEAMAGRRSDPLYRRPEGMVSHSLACIRLLQRKVSVTPFQGHKKVFLVGDADRMIVQRASQEAANALLKVLEEPPEDTVLILTTSEPHALLPTIRSRLVPTRVGRVGDSVVRAFLERELDPPPEGAALESRVLLAEGSIGRALWSSEEGDAAGRAADALLDAVRKGPGSWSRVALAQTPWSARGDFSHTLDALAVRLRDGLVERAEAGGELRGWLEALERVEETRAEAQGNVNPQLALAVLAGDLERLL
ncbi:MAG: DNA polymerase III subunit [Gemmatimonadota bacterium]|nr:MAG: DNA polymerase III subunit [Gemmatimonadota bacterium]